VPLPGYGIRGMDVDRNGIVWLPLDSGHLASFDRRKCKGPLNGPGAEKDETYPEAFDFYALSGAGFQGDPGAEENRYYVWVDQHDILGLGANVPFETGNQSDSLHALVDGHFVELRVPYPMGFFTKGLEGRIDDPKAGWRGARPMGELGQPHAAARRGDRCTPSGRARGDARDIVEPARRRIPAPPGPARTLSGCLKLKLAADASASIAPLGFSRCRRDCAPHAPPVGFREDQGGQRRGLRNCRRR
jgi:hypothetical protein